MNTPTVSKETSIGIVGLGYVGLPLAAALSHHFDVTGFDIDQARVRELEDLFDRTNELDREKLAAASVTYTTEAETLSACDYLIVTVPTPVDETQTPDLTAVRKASETVGRVVKKGATIVYESTVYPGVTEDICGPIIEATSGLKIGEDLTLGYSPERINPGDRVHTVDKITKVVSAQTPEAVAALKAIYGAMNGDRIFVAKDIRTAEASKVIENAQRDINIAFVNEISLIFEKMGISVYDVLEAARSKWNFLDFRPGLVGGHCIGVDPYYLAYAAQALGHDPQVILAGRRINDAMGASLAQRIHDMLGGGPKQILVMGVAFKENVPDIRNSKVIDLIRALETHGHRVDICDPFADAAETEHEYGLALKNELNNDYDCIVGAVPHDPYLALDFTNLLKKDGLVADIKGMWREQKKPVGIRYWSL